MRMISASAPDLPDKAKEYVVTQIRNPDPESEFARRARDFQRLSDEAAYQTLIRAGYDGILILHEDDSVIAHAFYQRHVDSVEAFSFLVAKHFRRAGYALVLVQYLLDVARDSDVHLLRITGGGSVAMMKLYEKIEQGKTDLPCVARRDLGVGWLEPLVSRKAA
jgi:GNAT superfamily N-acetyltransferase